MFRPVPSQQCLHRTHTPAIFHTVSVTEIYRDGCQIIVKVVYDSHLRPRERNRIVHAPVVGVIRRRAVRCRVRIGSRVGVGSQRLLIRNRVRGYWQVHGFEESVK